MTTNKIIDLDKELSLLIYIKDITTPLNHSPLCEPTKLFYTVTY